MYVWLTYRWVKSLRNLMMGLNANVDTQTGFENLFLRLWKLNWLANLCPILRGILKHVDWKSIKQALNWFSFVWILWSVALVSIHTYMCTWYTVQDQCMYMSRYVYDCKETITPYIHVQCINTMSILPWYRCLVPGACACAWNTAYLVSMDQPCQTNEGKCRCEASLKLIKHKHKFRDKTIILKWILVFTHGFWWVKEGIFEYRHGEFGSFQYFLLNRNIYIFLCVNGGRRAMAYYRVSLLHDTEYNLRPT